VPELGGEFQPPTREQKLLVDFPSGFPLVIGPARARLHRRPGNGKAAWAKTGAPCLGEISKSKRALFALLLVVLTMGGLLGVRVVNPISNVWPRRGKAAGSSTAAAHDPGLATAPHVEAELGPNRKLLLLWFAADSSAVLAPDLVR